MTVLHVEGGGGDAASVCLVELIPWGHKLRDTSVLGSQICSLVQTGFQRPLDFRTGAVLTPPRKPSSTSAGQLSD